jgi:hypothetical protein
MDVKSLLRAAEDRYDEETEKIGQAVREELLIPFCDKHNMDFDSGMGCWSIENDLINIYGAKNYWDVNQKAYKAAKNDAECEKIVMKAQAFRELPETEALVEILEERTMRGASIGCNIASYTPGGSTMGKPKCACEGTGLIPPTNVLPKGEHQVYCPMHRIPRYWLQMQAYGGVVSKELRSNNRGLK